MAAPLGIFDSGVGGLTVAREIVKVLPNEDLLYLGDTARVPYGTRSPRTVRSYAERNVRFLTEMGVKALVIACNTVSAVAMEHVREIFSGPVIGVVEPGARQAAELSRTQTIAVLATATTVQSQAYHEAIRRQLPGAHVHALACPLFVPLAEEGWVEGTVPEAVARRYLAPLRGTKVDTLVLGCTHYPLLTKIIEQAAAEIVGSAVQVVDSASAVANVLAETLARASLAREDQQRASRKFYVTDSASGFASLAPRFLGAEISHVELVDLGSGQPIHT